MAKYTKKQLAEMKSEDLISIVMEQQTSIEAAAKSIAEQEVLITDMNSKIQKQSEAAEKSGVKEPIIGVHEKQKYEFVIHAFTLDGAKHTSKTASKDAELMAKLVNRGSGVIKLVEA